MAFLAWSALNGPLLCSRQCVCWQRWTCPLCCQSKDAGEVSSEQKERVEHLPPRGMQSHTDFMSSPLAHSQTWRSQPALDRSSLTHSVNSSCLKALSQPGNDFYCSITLMGQCTAFCWARRVTVRKATTMQRKVSLGNGCDPLFGTRAWNGIVMTEYIPCETGALWGMMLGLQILHYGSGLSRVMVVSFLCTAWFLGAD